MATGEVEPSPKPIPHHSRRAGRAVPPSGGDRRLLTAGATVPFIARYREEATGSLDEVSVSTVRDRLEQLAELDKRRQAVLRSWPSRAAR